jgi:hypothetical protein
MLTKVIIETFGDLKFIMWFETFVFTTAIFLLPSSKKISKILMTILLLYVFTELSTTIIKTDALGLADELRNRLTSLIYDITIILTFPLWLYILHLNLGLIKAFRYSLFIFIIFIVMDIIFFQKNDEFKSYIFCMGSLLYILLFFILSFQKLKNEEFVYLFSNEYRLISSPIFMFLGLSLIFAFVDVNLQKVKIYKNIDLYTITTNYINFISYSLLLWYIYIEYRNHKRVITEE